MEGPNNISFSTIALIIGCTLFFASALRFLVRGDLTGMMISGVAGIVVLIVLFKKQIISRN